MDNGMSRAPEVWVRNPDRTSFFNLGEYLVRQTSVGGFQEDNFVWKKTKENNRRQTEHPSLQSSGQSVDFNSGSLDLWHPQLSDSDAYWDICNIWLSPLFFAQWKTVSVHWQKSRCPGRIFSQIYLINLISKIFVCRCPGRRQALQQMLPGSCLTLDRRRPRKGKTSSFLLIFTLF